MKHLTTVDNIKKNVRPVSNNLDVDRIEIYIKESEQLYIKQVIGDSLFLDILAYVNAEDKTPYPDYSILLNGGTYEDRCNETRSLNGLIEALNYYVYAKLVKNNNFTVTRFGHVTKEDQYSNQSDLKDRLAQEKDALSVADSYIAECLLYLSNNRSQFPKFKKGKQKNRLRVGIIGD